jgi:hypothetical protein
MRQTVRASGSCFTGLAKEIQERRPVHHKIRLSSWLILTIMRVIFIRPAFSAGLLFIQIARLCASLSRRKPQFLGFVNAVYKRANDLQRPGNSHG